MTGRSNLRIGALMASDLVCLYGVWGLVVVGYWFSGLGHYALPTYLKFWPVGLCFVGLNALFRLYHGNILYPAAPLSPVEELRRLVGSALATHVGVVAFLALAHQTTENYSRLVIVVSGLLTAFLAQPCRDLIRLALFKLKWGQIPVLLAGSGHTARQVAESLADNTHVGFRIVGYCGREDAACEGLPRLGDLRQTVDVARQRGVRILLACQDERMFRAQMADFAKWFHHIEYLPSANAFPVYGSRTISFDGIGGVEMVNQGGMRMLKVEKWIVDKALTLLAIVALSPLFLLIPALIKLTSRGPVFYRHERLGRGGRPIRVWKFRSMYVDADERLARLCAQDKTVAHEWNAAFKLRQDPRVTPLGRILRKTSLDEIPQLLNVIGGTMALVGPRPIVREEVANYGSAYGVFSSVNPGITGLWQVSGRSDTDYARRVALDVQYVLNWSPWLDVWILGRTVYSVVFMRGAC